MSRAGRRALGGKRELRRQADADVTKIIELSQEGRSTRAIASSVGLAPDFVHLVLERAREVEEGGGDSFHPPPCPSTSAMR
jgi:hypothetical protein